MNRASNVLFKNTGGRRILGTLLHLTAAMTLMAVEASAQVDVTATGGTPAASYTTLKGAFDALNAGTHTGAITIGISASTTETGPAVLNSGDATPASYTSVLIRPTVDGVSISGPTVSGRGLIELNGADNVTIDGDNPNTSGTSRNLTLQNTAVNTTTYTSVVRIALSTLITSGNSDTVKNCIIQGSATGRNISTATSTSGSEHTTYGILVGGGASTVSVTTAPSAITSITTTIGTGVTATSFVADNNQIDACARGIAVQGSTTTVADPLTVTNNVIGSATTGNTTTVYSRGMTLQGFNNALISKNTIRNMEWFVGTSQQAIGLGEVASSGTNATVEKNIITHILNSNTSTFGAYGINLAAGANITVRNNFVSDINHDMTGGGAFSTNFGVFGIRVAASTGHKIYNNSVNLFGTMPGTPTNTLLSAAFAIVATTQTGLDVRNNVFSNTLTGGTTSIAHVAVFLPSSGTSAMNLTWNNNAYYTGSTAGVHGVSHTGGTYTSPAVGTPTFSGLRDAASFNPADTATVANLRHYTSTLSAAGTNDNASFASSAAAPFISSTDLHVQNFANPLDGTAAPIAGVTDDIDNETRNVTTPDIGADEFTAGGPTLTPTNTLTPTLTPTITLTPTVTLTPTLTPTPEPASGSICNSSSISIPLTINNGSPYPSDITVSGINPNLTSLTVRLLGIAHTFPDDIDILLVGPGGQNLIIMSDIGGGTDITNVDLTLDDAAGTALLDAGPLVTGTFKPNNVGAGDVFTAPAPVPSGATTLSTFVGSNPNGTWSLYVTDQFDGDGGQIAGGWCIDYAASSVVPSPTDTATITQTPTITQTRTVTQTPTITQTRTATSTPTANPDSCPGPDTFGYLCGSATFSYQDISTTGTLVGGDDDVSFNVTLTDPFPYYGTNITTLVVNTNGWVSDPNNGAPTQAQMRTEVPIANAGVPNNAIFAFWDDLDSDTVACTGSGIWYQDFSGYAIVQWKVDLWSEASGCSGAPNYDFELKLFDNGNIEAHYNTMPNSGATGAAGIENAGGTDGLLYSFDQAVLTSGFAERYTYPVLNTATPTNTATATMTATPVPPTNTPTITLTPTITPTVPPGSTNTPTPTITQTPTNTHTPTSTNTPVPATSTSTSTPVPPTSTSTSTRTVTSTPTSTSTAAPAPPNDLCGGAEVIPPTGPFPYLTSAVNITNATTTGDPVTLPACTDSLAVSRSVWYSFTPANTGTYKFSLCNTLATSCSVTDTILAIFTATSACTAPYTQLSGACNDDACGLSGFQSELPAVALTSGTTYYIVAWKYSTTAPGASNNLMQMFVDQVLPTPTPTATVTGTPPTATQTLTPSLTPTRTLTPTPTINTAGCPGPDAFGYICSGTTFNYEDISNTGTFVGQADDASFNVTLADPFIYYGTNISTLVVNSNGWVSDPNNGAPTASQMRNEVAIANVAAPNNAIFAFWDDMQQDPNCAGSGIWFQDFTGYAIVQWKTDRFTCAGAPDNDFELKLFDNGNIEVHYNTIETTSPGLSAGVGIENAGGTGGLQYLFHQTITAGTAEAFIYPGNPTPGPTATFTATPTGPSPTPTITLTPSLTRTPTQTLTPSVTPTRTITPTPTINTSSCPGPDAFGYLCGGATFSYQDISTTGTLVGQGDDVSFNVTLANPFVYYGTNINTLVVNTNGWVSDPNNGAPSQAQMRGNVAISNVAPPNNAIFAFWDDLNTSASCGTGFGTWYQDFAGYAIIQWKADLFSPACAGTPDYDFELKLYDNGNIEAHYNTMPNGGATGSAGIENVGGTGGLEYSLNLPVLVSGFAEQYVYPGNPTPLPTSTPTSTATVTPTTTGTPPTATSTATATATFTVTATRTITATPTQTSTPILCPGPDAFGYLCGGTTFSYQDISSTGTLVGADDDLSFNVTLADPFLYYGTNITTLVVNTNGWVSDPNNGAPDSTQMRSNTRLPAVAPPNNAISAFWDDLDSDTVACTGSGIWYQDFAGYAIVQWKVDLWSEASGCSGAPNYDFELKLFDNGNIEAHYNTMPNSGATGSAGIENAGGTSGLQYGFNQSVLTSGSAEQYIYPGNPTPGPTNTPTVTATPGGPTSTATATPSGPTSTPTRTSTPGGPTPTRTATATATLPIVPTSTSTATAVPPTATRTATAVPPTATSTATAVPPTATSTATAVPPTATSTAVPPTATSTAVPPTATSTAVPPTATSTAVPPTATATPTLPPTYVQLTSSTATSGSPLAVDYDLPAGDYHFCVVENGTFTVGTVYEGTPVVCTDVTATRSSGNVEVWASAQVGSYDVIVIEHMSGTIFTGDDLGPDAGVVVQQLVSSLAGNWAFALFALLVLGTALGRRSLPSGKGRA